ncbi:polysaccharide deacetylase [Aquibium sp. A9E412]|uniref:polysaccharide deacetylase family protein n=1 Tax=Aquibium sp. A9E412 TaxID=2976767 RepID=UPI0025B23931|nr:polysaccharide deacetylase [Aquibium sp. A9E412]MDN2565754.1 polysaccharide deacetylase [Aquibium sp. A9E412]
MTKPVFRPAEPVEWPGGKKAAVAFTFDVDAESPLLVTNPKLAERMATITHQAYGPMVGVPRILDSLKAVGITSSFYVPGYVAQRYPDQIRRIVDEGHEVGHHGYLHEPLAGLSEAEERGHMERGLDALNTVLGVAPKGYRAPIWEMNWHTPRLIEEYGFLYDSSLMDSDHPYELDCGGGKSVVELPINWILDDWQQYCFVPDFSGTGLIETPQKTIELFQSELDAMREAGGLWVLTCHPFLSGRPGRAAALQGLMRYAIECGDVWIAPMHEIASHVRSLSLSPRGLCQPTPAV